MNRKRSKLIDGWERLTLETGEDNFDAAFLDLADTIAGVDHIMVFASPAGQAPRCIINRGAITTPIAEAAADRHVKRLASHGSLARADQHRQADGPVWLEDQSMTGGSGSLRAQWPEPGVFIEMATFHDVREHVGFIVQFYRTGSRGFTDYQRSRLRRFDRMLAAALCKHFGYLQVVETRDQCLIGRVLTEAPAFQAITRRERLVCVGILAGHTSESIAINLDISINSVLTYRKRLYRKLGISSQNELFIRIFDSVFAMDANDDVDMPRPRHADRPAPFTRRERHIRSPLGADLESAQAFFSKQQVRRACAA